MSGSIAWTRKYRPTKLSEYVGNDHTKEKVKALITRGRLPQTILLQGEKGTGKTTMARLIAKSMMCQSVRDGEACGECGSCIQLDDNYIRNGVAPRNMSVYEFDITKMNTRDHATVIVDRMSKRAFGSSKRVYILDEMQRATPEAQSSFLKITEEPGEGLYVIICTTDPEDLLVPLRSRFNKFNIMKPSNKDIVNRLQYICQHEGVNYTDEGLRLLADRNNNVPRDTILQAETVGMTGRIDRGNVEKELHLISKEIFMDFLDACHLGNLSGVVTMLDKIQETESLALLDFVEGMGSYLGDLLNARSGVKLDKYSSEDIKRMRKYVKQYDDQQIIGMLRILKEYSHITKSMQFQMLSLSVSFMDALKIEEKVKEVDESKAGARFSEVTRQVKEAKGVTPIPRATNSDITAIFGDVRKVVVTDEE